MQLSEYLGHGEKILIIDDFLATGATILGLVRLAQTAGAEVVVIGALVEKVFEGGRCELFPWDASTEQVLALNPKGNILSGGPASVYVTGAPQIPTYVLESGLPVLGICYGMHALTYMLGGQVAPTAQREYGLAQLPAPTLATNS